MARGWESKSVEAQIDMAASNHRRAILDETPDPVILQRIRQKENLQLSRTRIARELGQSQNPRYREMLNKALADLDARLASLA
jgi:hypothetical protein